MDVVRGEMVEKELTAFIGKRDKQRRKVEGERRIEEAWMESERRYNDKRQQENKAAWYGWHLDQAERHRRTLEELVRQHEAQAARLCEEGVA
jgi:hypothetical protein